ncbi:MAG TPA: hypothetical protein VH105_13065 [Burkholderiales bacterium]|nr:hypothetical protein [Burkholderiales bacterium]
MSAARIRFEVSVNGAVKCVAGIEEFGVLSAIVGWVKRSPQTLTPGMRAKAGFNENDFLEEKISLDVSGLDSAADEHVHWLQEGLAPGDVVTIKVLGVK